MYLQSSGACGAQDSMQTITATQQMSQAFHATLPNYLASHSQTASSPPLLHTDVTSWKRSGLRDYPNTVSSSEKR